MLPKAAAQQACAFNATSSFWPIYACRAAIVGETTFGKGVVQEYFGETDGSGIKLTVAKYLTPSGYDITRQGGIRPDAVCHDHPRGLTGLPDTCIAKALHGIAAELDTDG